MFNGCFVLEEVFIFLLCNERVNYPKLLLVTQAIRSTGGRTQTGRDKWSIFARVRSFIHSLKLTSLTIILKKKRKLTIMSYLHVWTKNSH